MHAHNSGSRLVCPALIQWVGLAIWLVMIPRCSRILAVDERQTAASQAVSSPAPRWDGVVDLFGREQNPFSDPSNRAVVLIFISIECPVCNRYAPEIQRLQARFSKQGVVFWLVQPTTDETREKTRQHLNEFGYSVGLLRDPNHALVRLAGARMTPEAAVFTPGTKLVYHGRIDDREADYGKTRPAPTQRELNDALEALLAGHPIAVSHAPAVGCFIPR